MSTPTTEIIAKYDPGGQTSLSEWMAATQRSLVIEALDPKPNEIIVEVGAGTGKLTHFLAHSAGARVIAIETSRSLRELGKRRTEGLVVEWLSGNPDDIPLEEDSADAVLLVNLLEFVPDAGEVLEEARRVLRPEGRLVVGVVGALSPWAALYRYLGRQGVEPWSGARFWTRDELARMLGVADEEVRGAVHLAPGAQPPYDEADAAGRRAGNRSAFLLAAGSRSSGPAGGEGRPADHSML